MTSANRIECPIVNGPGSDALVLRCLRDGQRPYFELRCCDRKIRVQACIESVGHSGCPHSLPEYDGDRYSWNVTGWIRCQGATDEKAHWVPFTAIYLSNHRRGNMAGEFSHFFKE